MDHDSDVAMAAAVEGDVWQPDAERRREGERRRPRGWLERRAWRYGIEVDRRRPVGREDGWARTLLPFWRRGKL